MEKNTNKKRPDVREKTLRYGLSYPLDEELLMLILGSGNRDMSVEIMARKILEVVDGSNEDNLVRNLLAMKGVGMGKALAVAAAIEFGKRKSCHLGVLIKSPGDLLPYIRHYAIEQKEHFLMVTLNGGHNIISIHVVSVGTLNKTIIHPREVFVEAIQEKAAAIILCHNHPSGRTLPSDDDIETTRVLIQASHILGIPILDHIIFDCDTYFSFVESELLFSKEE